MLEIIPDDIRIKKNTANKIEMILNSPNDNRRKLILVLNMIDYEKHQHLALDFAEHLLHTVDNSEELNPELLNAIRVGRQHLFSQMDIDIVDQTRKGLQLISDTSPNTIIPNAKWSKLVDAVHMAFLVATRFELHSRGKINGLNGKRPDARDISDIVAEAASLRTLSTNSKLIASNEQDPKAKYTASEVERSWQLKRISFYYAD
ncbi:MAG: hypothetical protein AAFV93_16815 [Chloroflexota bacterium]